MIDPRVGVTPTSCPHCGVLLNAARCPDNPNARPKPGDVTVCSHCSGVLYFDNNNGLVTREDFLKGPPETACHHLTTARQ